MPGKPVRRLAVRILTGYSAFCVISIGLAIYFAHAASWGLSSRSIFTLSQLLLLLLWVGVHFHRLGQFLGSVPAADRRFAFVQYAWVYGPMTFAIAALWCGWILDAADYALLIPGLRSTPHEAAIRWLAVLASVTWVLVSAPIARLWATNTAENPEALLSAENLLFLDERQQEFEAQVSVPSYYALILSALAMLFLIIDSIFGELFERLTEIGGYVGSIIASIVVATMLYPIQRRFNAFAARMRDVAEESGRADAFYAVRSAIKSTRHYLSAGSDGIVIFIVVFYVLLGWGLGSLSVVKVVW